MFGLLTPCSFQSARSRFTLVALYTILHLPFTYGAYFQAFWDDGIADYTAVIHFDTPAFYANLRWV
jgi:hypothetical protein